MTDTETNKVVFGLENVTIFPKAGDLQWDAPFPLLGAVNLSLSPSGSSSPFYADNKLFYNSVANTGWSGDLEMAKFPDEFYVKCLGWKKDARGGLVEVSDAVPAPFAIAFEVSGDKEKRRVVYYECTCTRPADEAKTKEETVTPNTQKTTITAVPVKFPEVETARYVLPAGTEDKEAYDGFYDRVVEPKMTADAATPPEEGVSDEPGGDQQV